MQITEGVGGKKNDLSITIMVLCDRVSRPKGNWTEEERRPNTVEFRNRREGEAYGEEKRKTRRGGR
jgi:hypothetical protein